MLRNSKGSALITILFMVFVLSIIIISLLNFTYFYYSDSIFLYERSKLKIISEMELAQTIRELKENRLSLTPIQRTNTDRFTYTLERKLSTNGNIQKLEIKLKGNNALITRKIEFFYIPPIYFSYFNNDTLTSPADTSTVLYGFFFARSLQSYLPRLLVVYQAPSLFLQDTNTLLYPFIGKAFLDDDTIKVELQQKVPKVFHGEFSINIDEIFYKAFKIVNKDWIIKNYSKYESFPNPILSKKTLLGTLRGNSLSIKEKLEIGNLYFSDSPKQKIDPLKNVDSFGSRGYYSTAWISLEKNKLSFVDEPVKISLPTEAFNKPFEINLDLPNTRIIGSYRRIKGIYFDSKEINLLNTDDIKLVKNKIKMVSREIRERYFLELGKGNNIKKEFNLPPNITPQKVFINDTLVKDFFVEGIKLKLPYPPSSDEEVVIMTKIPEIYISKYPPREGTYIYTDSTEKAEIINLSEINNLPYPPLILSYVPLIIRGTPNEPIIILSTENIYLENFNDLPEAKVTVLISKKGIFNRNYSKKIFNVVVISELDGFYTTPNFHISELSENSAEKKVILGNLLLSGKLKNANFSKEGYIQTPESPISYSILTSEMVMNNYFSSTSFGETIRILLPPFVSIKIIK